LNIEKVIQEDRQAKLTVEYSQEEFEGLKRRAAKKISSNTKIPGFRPGRVPYQVVVNRFGEDSIIQEAIDILLETDYSKILEEAEIKPSGAGNLEAIESYDPPKLVFFVPLEPEIDLGDYREIRIPFEPEDFDISEVDRYIMSLRRNSATITPANRPAEVEDLVYFSLSGEFLNPGENEEAVITDNSPQQVVIPNEDESSTTEWPYPGFARALLGVKSGDVKEMQHTYSEDYPDEDYQGKTAIYTVEVQSVKALEIPEFDDDFVQSMGTYETPEDFREAIEAQMQEEHDENYEQEYFNAIVNEIIENASIAYPPQMLEHEEEHVLEDIKSRLEKQNLDFPTFLKLRNTDEEKFMVEEVKPAAKQRLERSLVIDTLVDAEGLKLDQELFNDQINIVMGEIFQSGNYEEMQKQLGKDEFSRAISMEGLSRTINTQLKNRLILISKGLPIPNEDEIDIAEAVEGDDDTLTKGDAEVADAQNETDQTENGELTESSDSMALVENAAAIKAEPKESISDEPEIAIVEQNDDSVEIPEISDMSEENDPGEESDQETDSANNT
jgi:trigger factor